MLHSQDQYSLFKETNMAGDKKKQKNITMKQGIELYRTMLESVTKDGEYIKYKDDVSDSTLAKQFGFSTGQVLRFRLENVGKFRPTGNPGGNPQLKAGHNTLTLLSKVEQLERKLVVLNAKYNDLMTRHNKLCLALSLGRVYPSAKDYVVPEVDSENK